jgi:Zn-dependent protease with chaperone function
MRPAMCTRLIAALACASLLSAGARAAQSVQLLDVQPNPHWREGLHEQADTVIAKRVEQARQAGELGCRDYCAMLANVFPRVTAAASAQLPGAPPIDWQLIVIRSKGDDAYALPDGRIVVSEAFIAREHLNIDELAFVLAHEASHVILAHEADTLDTVQALLPHGVNQSVQDLYAAMDFDMGLLLKISPLTVRMEEEADRTGLMLAALAGFDPDSASGYVERLSATEQQTVVATHPQGLRRLTQLREALPLARRVYERFGQTDNSSLR